MTEPMVMRLRTRTLGSHVHVDVFTATGRPDRHGTFAKAGELTFTVEEWPIVRCAFRHGGWMHVEQVSED